MFSFLEYDFMIRALLAGCGIAIICPLIWSVILMRKSVMQADVLAHSALTWVSLGVWMGISHLVTTLFYTITSSVIVESLRNNKRLSSDTLMSLFFSANLAIAILLLSLSHGFTSQLNRFLFGSVVLIGKNDLILLLWVCATIWISTGVYWKLFWSVLIDEISSKVAGLPIKKINFFLAILVWWGITASLTIVGLLLVSTLLIIPLMIAWQLTKSFKSTLLYAEITSIVVTVSGIILSYYTDIPASAMITGMLIVIFICVLLGKMIYEKNKTIS